MLRLLFLGDSYTCCSNEPYDVNRWPLRLAMKILGKKVYQVYLQYSQREDGHDGFQCTSDFALLDPKTRDICAEIKIIAKSGKRSDELLVEIKKQQLQLKAYDGVFILIGVNDQFQKGKAGIPEYQKYLTSILEEAILATQNNDSSKITLLAIPDWSQTKSGQDLGTHTYRTQEYELPCQSTIKTVYSEISAYNQAAKFVIDEFNQTHKTHINFIASIESISRQFGLFPKMTLEDGLHYRWDMTEKWNAEIFSQVPFLQKYKLPVLDNEEKLSPGLKIFPV